MTRSLDDKITENAFFLLIAFFYILANTRGEEKSKEIHAKRKNFLNLSSKIIFVTAYYIERENYYRVISLNNHSQKII